MFDFKEIRGRVGLMMVFMGLFYFGMACSKMVHVLWFRENGTLEIFGFGYSVMALAGIFSFVYSGLAHRWGMVRCMQLGCIFYSVAMFLRIFAHSYVIAGVSGVLGGMGAGTSILFLRYLVVSASSEFDRAKIISWKNAVVNGSAACGTAFAGWLVVYLGSRGDSYVKVLLIAGLFPLLCLPLIPKLVGVDGKDEEKGSEPVWVTMKNAFHSNKRLTMSLIFLSALVGIYSSLIVPYMPVILAELGLNAEYLGVLIGAAAVVGPIGQLILKHYCVGEFKERIFFVVQILLGVMTLMFSFKLGMVGLIVVVLLRAVLSGLAKLVGELMEISMISGKNSVIFLGIMQSSFLIGDMVGGGIAGVVFTEYGVRSLVYLAAGLIGIEGVLMPFIYRVNRKLA